MIGDTVGMASEEPDWDEIERLVRRLERALPTSDLPGASELIAAVRRAKRAARSARVANEE